MTLINIKVNEVWKTNDYDRFTLHIGNRDVKKIKGLKNSMLKKGYSKACPIVVYIGIDGFFHIIFGHHRFKVAKMLKLPVCYMVVSLEECPDLYEAETSTNQWQMTDFLTSNVRRENFEYLKVEDYHERTGIPINTCVSLLAGNVGSTGNYTKVFKKGGYKVKDPVYAETIGDIVICMKNQGISFATTSLFVSPLSKCVRVRDFDVEYFKGKIAKKKHLMEKQATANKYLEMIEMVYNHGRKEKIPLAFLADKVANERSAVKPKASSIKKSIRPVQEPDAKNNKKYQHAMI